MRYAIQIDRRRNRIYFTPPAGLNVPGVNYEGDRRWWGWASAPAHTKTEISKYLDSLVASKAEQDAAAAAFAAIKANIPADYRRRHGTLYGGTADIGDGPDEVIAPAFGTLRAPKWQQIAQLITRAPNRPGSLISGRVMDCDTLYSVALADGRMVYREVTERGCGDDQRESYWFPLDLFAAVCRAEITARGITPEIAVEWLAQSRGCVDTELYEFAAQSLPGVQSGLQISASAGVSALVSGQPGDVTPRLTKVVVPI